LSFVDAHLDHTGYQRRIGNEKNESSGSDDTSVSFRTDGFRFHAALQAGYSMSAAASPYRAIESSPAVAAALERFLERQDLSNKQLGLR
jgi:hypothetical protein